MNEPLLSVILATDTFATIRPVIERLRRQTIRSRIELVLVAPSKAAVSQVLSHAQEFAGIQILEDPATDLAVARALGIRACTASAVFVGETHSYPHPDLAETLVRLLSAWSCVTPGLGNANPNSAVSWAGLLSDYGSRLVGLTGGEIYFTPVYNAAFRRSVLLDFGDQLTAVLGPGDEMDKAFRAAGHRAYFEPSAHLDHVNVAGLRHWIRERYAAGILIASQRIQRWPLSRRLLYLFGSPLIPPVLFWRVLPGSWATVRRNRLPFVTILLIGFGMAVKGLGELAGYLGASSQRADKQMLEYEIHKVAYAGRGRS